MIGLVFLLLAVLVPFALGSVLARRFTNWTTWRVLLVAAAPIPAATLLFIMLLIVAAFEDSPTDGGLGMAVLSAFPEIAVSAISYVLSLGIAAIGLYAARRDIVRSGSKIDEIFE